MEKAPMNERGKRLLEALEAGKLDPAYIEGAEIGYAILGLLERIKQLEEDLHGQRQESGES
jgi:hypothetical protein